MMATEEMVRSDYSKAKGWEYNQPFETYYARLKGGTHLTPLSHEQTVRGAAWTFGNDLLVDGGLADDTEIEVFSPGGTLHVLFLRVQEGQHVYVETQSARSDRQANQGIPPRRSRCITLG